MMIRRTDRERPVLLLALLACLALLLPSCLISSKSNTEKSGQFVSEQTLSKVTPGHSTGYVLTLLGEPSARTPDEKGSEIWKWQFTTVKKSGGSVFLVLSADSRQESSGAAYVEFQDGIVVSSWRD